MATYFKPYYHGCLAHASYVIGGSDGSAAVIDPRRDVDEYIADAAEAGLMIRYVIETHLHADFVSGHQELARRTGADICITANPGPECPHQPVRDAGWLAGGMEAWRKAGGEVRTITQVMPAELRARLSVGDVVGGWAAWQAAEA